LGHIVVKEGVEIKMTHFKELCKICKTVMSQCRCPSPDKEIRYGVCKECSRITTEKGFPEKFPGLLTISFTDKYPAIGWVARCKDIREKCVSRQLLIEGLSRFISSNGKPSVLKKELEQLGIGLQEMKVE